MEIRPASPSNAEEILHVFETSCRAAYADVLDDDTFIEMVAEMDAEPLRSRLADASDDADVVYIVAVEDGEIRGFLQLLCGTRVPDHVESGAFLKSLYIHPDHWSEGIGTRLIDAAVQRLHDTTESIQLAVLSANEAAKGFYEAYGFEQVATGTFEANAVDYETAIYAMTVD